MEVKCGDKDKLTEAVKKAISEVDIIMKGSNDEVSRLGRLHMVIEQLAGRQVNLEILQILVDHIWKRPICKKITRYNIMLRLAMLEFLCQSYLDEKIPPTLVIKCTKIGYEVIRQLITDKFMFNGATQLIEMKWIHKQIMRCIYKLLKQKQVTSSKLNELLSPEEKSKMLDYLPYFYANLAYSKLANPDKILLIKEIVILFDLKGDSIYCDKFIGPIACGEPERNIEFWNRVRLKLLHRMELDPGYKLHCEIGEKLKRSLVNADEDISNIGDTFEEWLKVREITKEESRMLNAISFIYNATGGKATEDHTEFAFDFVNIAETMFSKTFRKKKKPSKFNKLIAFTRTWQMLFKSETILPFFQDTLILKAIGVYKKLIKDEDVAEYAAMGLNLLAKLIKADDYTMKYAELIIPTIVIGYLMNNRSSTKKAVMKLLDDSLNHLFSSDCPTETYQKLQFLNMAELTKDSHFVQSLKIRERVYKSEPSVALKAMLNYLPDANVCSQNLILIYLNDILDARNDPYLEELKTVFDEDKELMKIVCQNVLKVNKSYTVRKQDIKVAQSCAFCIQILGPSIIASNIQQYSESFWISPLELLDLRGKLEDLGELLLSHIQSLTFKATKHFLNYIVSIWRLKCILFVDANGDLKRKIPEKLNNKFYFPESGSYDRIQQKIIVEKRNEENYEILQSYKETQNLRLFCLYLINKIDKDEPRKIFSSIESIIRTDTNILADIIPMMIFLVFYHSKGDAEVVLMKQITGYLCEVLEGSVAAHKQAVFYCIDYLKKIKAAVNSKIREDVKSTLHITLPDEFLESEATGKPTIGESQSLSVISYISGSEEMRTTLATNKLIARLIGGMPRLTLIKAAKSIKAYKVALYYFEEECRARAESTPDLQCYLFRVLNREELDLLIDIYRNVNKEDIKSEYFSGIIGASEWNREVSPLIEIIIAKEKSIIYNWRKGLWENLKAEVDKEELPDLIKNKVFYINFAASDIIPLGCIGKLLSFIYTWIHHSGPTKYKEQYEQVIGYIEFLQREIMIELCGVSTTSVYVYSFYLYVLYDIKRFVELIKAIISTNTSKPPIEILADKMYQQEFDRFCKECLEREVKLLGKDFDQLKTLYYTHRGLFQIIKRPLYAMLYTERLAILASKNKEDSLTAQDLFKECEPYKDFILDYELQYAKIQSSLENDYQTWKFLGAQLGDIKKKISQTEELGTKNLLQSITSKLAYERTLLYLIKLQERIDPTSKNIEKSYKELLNIPNARAWEKAYVRFAKYLEKCQIKDEHQGLIMNLYLNSLEHGHKYIWHSLPKALNIWLDLNMNADGSKVKLNKAVRDSLLKLDLFKIATAVPLLISRYGHPSAEVVSIIQDVIARLTVEYPMQQVWWLLNYYSFTEPPDKLAIVSEEEKKAHNGKQHAKGILEKVKSIKASSYQKIMVCEAPFTALKELSVKKERKGSAIPSEMLSKFKNCSLILPMREYLFPQLPPVNATKEEIAKHSAYNAKPAFIKSLGKHYKSLESKEAPKKIVMIGSNEVKYYFLLKHDKRGDISKEAKFINFVEVINQILKSDKECAKRNLCLQTYSIANVTSSDGLIEWLNNTETLRTVTLDLWKESGIDMDAGTVIQKCRAAGHGENIGKIWHELKKHCKPVVHHWFLRRFQDCESWFNARLNFIRSYAAWAMVGYICGLGDRHGDNILLNSQNGIVTNIDFDCLFEKGKQLNVPEIVPFRLTQNVLDALGIFREKTEFVITCNLILKALARHKDEIISNLQVFVHDPLFECLINKPIAPNLAIQQVSLKLEECSKNVDALLQKLIYQATSEENLKNMYYGWMPWA